MTEGEGKPVAFEGSVGEFLAGLAELSREDRCCTLIYQDEEIGAFIPMDAYQYLCEKRQQEAEAEAAQHRESDEVHKLEPWVSWSSYRRQHQAAEVQVEGEADAAVDP